MRTWTLIGISLWLGILTEVQVAGHSWIDQLVVISSSGAFVGNYGYARHYVSRSDAGYTAAENTYMLPTAVSLRPRINESDLLCAESQRTQSQSPAWPRLNVAPGDFVALKYTENGHVTLPWNTPGKPARGGTTFVYGTASPNREEKIMDVLCWNSGGTGGDGRGQLLAANDFDDGRCHQINDGCISLQRQQIYPNFDSNNTGVRNELYCETDVQIPGEAQLGSTYTLYWIWEWPTGSDGDAQGKDEWYTTCMDVNIVPGNERELFPANSALQAYPLDQQDPEPSAVVDFMSRSAARVTPVVYTAAISS